MLTTALIIDIVILAILLLFVALGARKGLLLSLCSLVAVLVALIGATVLADLLAPRAADYIEPKVAAVIEERLKDAISHTAVTDGKGGVATRPDEVSLPGVLGVLEDMGLQEIAQDAAEQLATSGAASAAKAMARGISRSIAYVCVFILGFIVILLLWTILAHALDLVTRLPGLSMLNKTGGALFGLVKGGIILFLCAWVCRYFGNFFSADLVQQTILLKFFLTTNPVTLLLAAKAVIS